MLRESPQDLSGGLRDLKTPELLRERCDSAFRGLAALAAGTVAVSVILSAFLWRSQPLEQVLFWQCVMLALAAYVASLAWFYRRRAKPGGHPGLWVRRLAIAAAALGAGWGYGAAAFFPGGVDQQVFLSF